ncbi:hypothetical protein FAI41_07850 [Acetobacteraceae bacterium]|nr:hypothetical protein FAI41_07850 [Acetobacteraceae bacterium]
MILLSLFLLLLLAFSAFFLGAGRKFSPSFLSLAIILPLPLIALGLYGFFGNPSIPSATKSAPKIPKQIQQTFAKLEITAEQTPDPVLRSQKLRLLAEIAFRSNAKDFALKMWQKSLDAHFSSESAIELAEAESEQAGYVTKPAQALYAKSLENPLINANDPKAPTWQKIAQMRLMQAEQEREKEGDETQLLSPENAS